jgi:hypothetical protein
VIKNNFGLKRLKFYLKKNIYFFYFLVFIRRILNLNVKRFSQLDFQDLSRESRILIIGPGILPIPPANWGGVEQVIFRQVDNFRKIGEANIDLLNSAKHVDWLRAWLRKPNVVYCHYDVFAPRLRIYKFLFRIKVVGISHFGFTDQLEKWDRANSFFFKNLVKLDLVICLSSSIQKVFSNIDPNAQLKIIPNSVSVSKYHVQEPKNDLIYLGKVEPRKRQFELAQKLDVKTDITFIGPIEDSRIFNLPKEKQNWFVGALPQIELDKTLPKFKCLLLTSTGEGDAAVLYEAQACGLSIGISNQAKGAQNIMLPWIKILELESDKLISDIEDLILNNAKFRQEIRIYASKFYDSDITDKKLFEILVKVSKE